MGAEPTNVWSFLAPRFAGAWCWWVCLRLLSWLPPVTYQPAGRWLGKLLALVMPRRRHIAQVNLARCFPALSDAQLAGTLDRHFHSLGMGFIETGAGWWAAEQRLRPLATVDGLEHLEQALHRGRGVLLVSGHFTTFEMGLRLLSLFTRFDMLYRPHNNPLMERIITRGRLGHLRKLIPRDDIRGLLRSLAENMPVWYAPDQNYGRRQSCFVPFFAELAATVTATSRIARLSGATIVPYFPLRLPGQAGYQLTLLEGLSDFPSGDDSHDAQRLNEILEGQILHAVDQYLWIHRRFKSRPQEGEDIYS